MPCIGYMTFIVLSLSIYFPLRVFIIRLANDVFALCLLIFNVPVKTVTRLANNFASRKKRERKKNNCCFLETWDLGDRQCILSILSIRKTYLTTRINAECDECPFWSMNEPKYQSWQPIRRTCSSKREFFWYSFGI